MDAFLISTGIVALAEIGDKTQLLALLLAARYRQPLTILAGIFVATVANHALAGWFGTLITSFLGPEAVRWVLGVSFLAMAVWVMIPDKVDAEEARHARYGAFLSTLIIFFLAEMGDKTQVATLALAAQYANLVAVVAGTTLGMMLANIPAVYLSEKLLQRVPLRLVHAIAALLFVVLGLFTLLGVGGLAVS